MDIKLIEIKFEYKENIVTIKTETYRTIKELKEKAIKKFFNIPKDIHCFYLSRDLTPYENDSIGELFNNREKVTLKLMPPKKPIFPIKKKILSKKEDLVFSNINLNTNVFSSGFNNISRFQTIKLKESNSLEKKKKKNKKELMLPPIKNKNLSSDKKESITNERYKDLILDNIDEEDKECDNCAINKFSEYCRNCKEFVCFNCKKKKMHQNHLFIHLDPNYESSIKIYGNILLTDIEYLKVNNNDIIINKDINLFNNSTSLLNNNDLKEKQKELINKLKEIFNMYEGVINQLKDELVDGENKIKDLIRNYNKESIKINNDINQLLKKLETHEEKINIKEFKSYFKEMNENEKKLYNINKKIIKYHLNFQINKKISSILDKMEKIVNETIDQNNPYNLSPNLNNELKSILNKIKDGNINKIYKKSKTFINKTSKEENINDY